MAAFLQSDERALTATRLKTKTSSEK